MQKTVTCLFFAVLLLARPCAAGGPPPVILVQPLDVSVLFLNTASFSVTALSGTTLSYQWLKNGTNIPGATSATYSILSVGNADAGNYAVIVQNGGGSVTSSTVSLIVLTAPTITLPPLSQAVVVGENASFSTTAIGTSPLNYKWTFNGTSLSGATGSTLSLTDVATNQAGNYAVIVGNSYGSTTSAVATLTVYAPPVVSSQPQNQTVVQGQNISLSVAASGTAPLSYQWQATNSRGGGFTNLVNGGQISGANTNVLTISDVTTNNALAYQVIITNAFGAVTSSPAILNVIPPVLVDVQFLGTSGTGWPGGSGSPQTGPAVLGAPGDVWNQETLPYYVYPGTATNINAANLVNSANIASGLTLTVGSSANSVFGGHQTNGAPTDPATTNLMSSDIEEFVLSTNVDVWTFTIGGLSGYAGDQFNLVVYAGAPSPRTQTISLTGGASGGNTGSALTTSSTDCRLSNGAGDAFQIFTNGTLNGGNLVFTVNGGTAGVDTFAAFVNGFQLQVYSYPVIMAQPVSQTNSAGSTVQFSVTASGGLLSYQWQTNGGSGYVNVTNGGIFSGANSSVLTITSAPGSSSLSYQVIVANSAGSVTSAPATLTLTPQIINQPASQAVVAGQTAVFSITAAGSGPLGYQWNFNGVPLPGATNSALTLNNVLPAANGNYNLVVSNSAGAVTSAVASLSVTLPQVTLATSSGAVAGLSANGFGFQFAVPVGVTYVVLASSDLQNWTPIATNIATTASAAFNDVAATNYNHRYYRLMVH